MTEKSDSLQSDEQELDNQLSEVMNGHNDDLFIIGIGASAGGYEAIEKFFNNMPSNSGVAFVIVQHLSPDYKSLMVELLSKHTEMKVYRVEDGVAIEPDCVYLLPPKKNMNIYHGKLYLTETSHIHGLNLPINIFFRSLAEDKQDKAIGVILSGTGTDGTLGLRDIKGVGGMVMVQDVLTSKFDGMPRSAISTGLVDYVLPPEKMPEQLISYVQQISKTKTGIDSIVPEKKVDSLTKVLSLLNKSQNIDFGFYKPSTIIRRLEKRMSINQIDKMEDYIRFLQSSATEARILAQELLIGVTKFFRDPETFELVKERVIPQILINRKTGSPLRIWVAGCSTGEEAYSLAIIFLEYFEEHKENVDIKIFATDIDKNAIEIASTGIYPDSILADISQERLNRYFVREESTYQVRDTLRKMVIFAHQNIIKDPPFNKIDLITCRNLMIYLQPQAQKKVLSFFHFSLNPDGYLLLGKSESVGDMVNQFKSIDNKWKLYKKLGVHNVTLVDNHSFKISNKDVHLNRPAQQKIKTKSDATADFDAVYRSLMGSFEPSAILINKANEPEYIFGDANEYLNITKGKLNLNIFKMVNEDLSVAIGTAVRLTRKDRKEVVYTDLVLKNRGESKKLNLIVKPAFPDEEEITNIFIIFDDIKKTDDIKKVGEPLDVESLTNQHIRDLEQELQFTKESLQATVEELETSNEELQATNEELLASNEELQSTNEELQSVNEELITVNSEYQKKIEELVDLNNDYDNLLNSTDIGTLFLDYDLNIRKFTPRLKDEMKLVETDIGRPITHFSYSFLYKEFLTDIRKVLDSLKSIEREIKTEEDNWYLVKILPYKTSGEYVEGVVITLVDVTSRKELSDDLLFMRQIVEHSPFIVMKTDAEQKITYVNKQFTEVTGYGAEEVLGKTPAFLKADDDTNDYEAMWETLSSGKSWSGEFINKKKNGEKYFEVATLVPLKDRGGKISHIVKSAKDVTLRKKAQQEKEEYRTEKQKLHYQREHLLSNSEKQLLQAQKITFVGSWNWNMVEDKVTWSEEMFTIFELEPTTEPIDINKVMEFIHEDDKDRVKDAIENSFLSGKYDVEMRIRTEKNNVRWVRSKGEVEFDENEKPIKMIGTLQNITHYVEDKMAMEKRISELEEELSKLRDKK